MEQRYIKNQKIIKVTSLVNNIEDFYLDDNLTEPIINTVIIRIKKQTGNLLSEQLRSEIRQTIETSISNKTGKEFAYSLEYDLHSTFE